MNAHDPFNRWKVGPFASGATSLSGGHWRVLGLEHTWLPHPPYRQYEWSLFSLVALRWTTDRGWDFGFAKVELKFIRARWRYMARDEARWRRSARKRHAQNVKAALATARENGAVVHPRVAAVKGSPSLPRPDGGSP